MQNFLQGYRPYLLLALLWAMVALPGITSLPVMDRDEARFVQATRQMVESGDYVVVRFQDELRAKKPVGIYWLQAAAVNFFSHPASQEVWPYRLPSALGTLIAVLMTFRVGVALFDRKIAFVAAGMLATTLMVAVESHLAKTDGVLLGLTTVALGSFAMIYGHGKGLAPAPRWAALALWLAVGCGILVKGPITPLVLLLAALWVGIADRSVGFLRGIRPIMGVVVATAVVAPWFHAVSSATNGAFVQKAVAEDLLPKLLGAQESHGGFPGYYAVLIGVTAFPASLFLWPSVWRAWRKRSEPAIRMCLAWVLPGWALFEILPTKLPHYSLPFYPPLMLMIAAALFSLRDDTYARLGSMTARCWYGLWTVLILAFASGIVALPFFYGEGLSLWSLPAAIVLVLVVVRVWLALWKRLYLNAVVQGMLAAVVLYGSLLAGVALELPRLWVSQRTVAAMETFAPQALVAQHVAIAGYHEPSFVFLAGTKTKLVDGAGAAALLRDLGKTPEGAVVAVEEKMLPEFLQAWKLSSEAAPQETAIVSGVNYSRGKPVMLHVFTAQP